MKMGRVSWCPGLHVMRRIARRWSIALVLLASTSIFAPGVAHADDWGCQVLLCLSNPGGPEQYSECVPPIERLWNALRHGDPFPTCDFGADGWQGTFATNTFASGGYCLEDLLYWGGPEQSELLCSATGAINVDIDNQLYTRVWWDVSGQDRTLTEFYGTGSAQVPYDPSQSASKFLQQMEQQDSTGGGGAVMLPLDFIQLAQQCAPQVSPTTMAAIVRTESGFNPYAIGVVHGRLARQPVSEAEAIATAHALERDGWNFSVGLAQVNHANWPTYGLDERSAFDPCRNLAAGAAILQGCFELAREAHAHARASIDSQSALRAGLSCYASGDFSTGYRTGYVQRVVSNAPVVAASSASVAVPAITPIPIIPAYPDLTESPGQSRTQRRQASRPADTSSTKSGGDPDGSAVVF